MSESTDTRSVTGDDVDEGTGFPALRTWRGVYLTVLAIFCLWVVLLTALSRAFR